MKLRKWNYETRKYEPYEVPDFWKCKTYSDDMGEIVNCCQCGKPILFGDAYTSHEVHTEYGMGYAVCGECHFNVENERYYKEVGMDYDPTGQPLGWR